MLFLQTLVCELVLSDVSRRLLLQVMMLRQREERSIMKQQFLHSDWLTVCQISQISAKTSEIERKKV